MKRCWLDATLADCFATMRTSTWGRVRSTYPRR